VTFRQRLVEDYARYTRSFIKIADPRCCHPPRDVEAHKWANLAASRDTGDDREKAATRSRSAADARDSLATRMPPAQVAEAQRRAREWQAAFDARQE
jgi:hypothetical protein